MASPWALWTWTNYILQIRRPTQREIMQRAQSHRETQRKGWEPTGPSVRPFGSSIESKAACTLKNSFNWHLVKQERFSETWIKHCIFNSTWICEKPCSIHCKQSERWLSKPKQTQGRESAHPWKISDRTDNETKLLVSPHINITESDKTTAKENQTGQKTVQLKRKFSFVCTSTLMKQKKLK